MSVSYLYHAYNLKGVKYKSTEYIGNKIILNARMMFIVTDKYIDNNSDNKL